MLADAGHRSIPVAHRNPAEAGALVGCDHEPAVLRFRDDERICPSRRPGLANCAYTMSTLRCTGSIGSTKTCGGSCLHHAVISSSLAMSSGRPRVA